MKIITLMLTLFIMISSSVFGQDFDRGMAAYKAKDMKTALREFRPLAEQGNVRAMYRLFYIFINKPYLDNKKATKWLKLAAEGGDSSSQFSLGNAYYFGPNYELKDLRGGLFQVERDYRKAFKWYQLSAKQGNTNAQYSLGKLFNSGKGVIQDYSLAHMWFNIAIANGHWWPEHIAFDKNNLEKYKMTPQAILAAQAMARLCMSSDYKKCGYE